jgi:homoserine dehydrogenase
MAGDPLFVFDLREGREPRSDTRARILRAMQDEAESATQAPLRIGVAGLGNVGATLVGILARDGVELTRKLGRQVGAGQQCGAAGGGRKVGVAPSRVDRLFNPIDE